MNKVSFITLGCRVNLCETEAMMEKFKREGFLIVDPNEKADVCVINSCTV
ncbi:MAG: tRNA (N(6)-L-threonylcarbamoyladenosine(37)-C(2))-methylthiotransferase MtaB, partial [Oscillospiraceae bacterium]|nr:tRNA (N(6)-L-threonylcarbamoyladenosine(37)-C(2))-methylthiotransferase MtaB [Oscillospiraceae bacterium]